MFNLRFEMEKANGESDSFDPTRIRFTSSSLFLFPGTNVMDADSCLFFGCSDTSILDTGTLHSKLISA